MLLKKVLAVVIFLGLCILMTQMSEKIPAPITLLLHPLAGIIGLAFYCGRQFFRGPWDLIKTGILAGAMMFGYFFLLFYIFGTRNETALNRT